MEWNKIFYETDEELAWLKENYEVGENVGVDDNVCECGGWSIGERRCDCGNRRICGIIEVYGGNRYLIAEAY